MMRPLPCMKCGTSISMEYDNHYYCPDHKWKSSHGYVVVCRRCHTGETCPDCSKALTFHDGERASKWAKDRGIMFWVELNELHNWSLSPGLKLHHLVFKPDLAFILIPELCQKPIFDRSNHSQTIRTVSKLSHQLVRRSYGYLVAWSPRKEVRRFLWRAIAFMWYFHRLVRISKWDVRSRPVQGPCVLVI